MGRNVNKRANVLTDKDLTKVYAHIAGNSLRPERDALMVLLSFKLGLRACEIAGLRAEDVLDATGTMLKPNYWVSGKVAKNGKSRELPMEPVRDQLGRYMRNHNITRGPVFRNQYGEQMTPDSVAQQLGRIYRHAGFIGCSSHSGRRSFGTELARRANEGGCSILDVRDLLGHSDLSATQAYVQPSSRARELVLLLAG